MPFHTCDMSGVAHAAASVHDMRCFLHTSRGEVVAGGPLCSPPMYITAPLGLSSLSLPQSILLQVPINRFDVFRFPLPEIHACLASPCRSASWHQVLRILVGCLIFYTRALQGRPAYLFIDFGCSITWP